MATLAHVYFMRHEWSEERTTSTIRLLKFKIRNWTEKDLVFTLFIHELRGGSWWGIQHLLEIIGLFNDTLAKKIAFCLVKI